MKDIVYTTFHSYILCNIVVYKGEVLVISQMSVISWIACDEVVHPNNLMPLRKEVVAEVRA